MQYKTSQEIRHLFLKYFEQNDHMVEPGASLVPIDDDTLLWINSGVAALKKYFDGSIKPKNPRITNVQKSIRTNDIENVGYTARHHTFFEMLGNFSIGDYFKKEAIHFAYEFLFSEKWAGLDPKHMYVSVYMDDQEAYDIWVNEIGVNPNRILRTEDNFWQIGDGPCGPNTEIFYDRGPDFDHDNIGEKLFFEDLENDRYIEVWNVVFSQYNGIEGGDRATFKELPQKNIDTGMGFERLVSLIQKGDTNFDTDLFLPIIHQVEALTDKKYQEYKTAYRVIADHIRTLVFALNDGAMFSNEGRGYVLRRILRRAVRFGRVLDIEAAFLYNLVDTVISIMEDFYPNLNNKPQALKDLILKEEDRFAKTLVDGEKLLLDAIDKSNGKEIEGEVAFKLYDTYGFPIELTQEIAHEKGLKVDLDGFEKALQAQKERARSSRQKTESMSVQYEDILNFNTPSTFRYDTLVLESVITGIFVDGKRVDSFSGTALVATSETPFYAESGGQVSDKGWMNGAEVENVTKANGGQHLHIVHADTTLHEGDAVTLTVDKKRRQRITKNHSAVHLLHAALHTLVGENVNQAGSYKDDQYFRLDFTHGERLEKEKLVEIEDLVNTWIAQSIPVITEIMDLESAKKTGAQALFGDTYGDWVRVVTMGDVSKELCGGTHVNSTAEIGLFKIVSEESVGSGVRRIMGKTSLGAYEMVKSLEKNQDIIREHLKLVPQKTILDKVVEMENEYQDLKSKYDILLRGSIDSRVSDWLASSKKTSTGLSVLWIHEKELEKEVLNDIADKLKDKLDIVMIANEKEGGLGFLVTTSSSAIEKGFKAGDIARTLAQITGGNGGGRPNFAQAGGKDISKLNDAYQEICAKIELIG